MKLLYHYFLWNRESFRKSKLNSIKFVLNSYAVNIDNIEEIMQYHS
jgi:chemotaxis signal transduction protein